MIANRLYFGDCLDVMREDIPDASVDLIYLDPPFNSKRLYNAFIGDAQWVAFDDTWRWSEAVDDFHDVASDTDFAPTIEGLRRILGEGPNLAYLSYMANRLRECRRVLKPTGSIYLHCDPTMSHYLKLVMDGILGRSNYKNEIQWRRYGAHNDTGQGSKHFGRVHDIIFFYAKGQRQMWNQVFVPLDEKYIEKTYRHVEESTGRRFMTTPLTGPGGAAKGNPVYEWNGHTRAWRYSQKRMSQLHEKGQLYYSRTGYVRKKFYLDESKGAPAQDVWNDIQALTGAHKEKVGYPTQKPVALLERIITASCPDHGIVLDPFCGCGTTIHAAENLGRQWIGIDVCVNACKVIEKRISGAFPGLLWSEVEFIGMPKTTDDAKTLASLDKFRFERWAASLVDGMEPNTRQRGDKGIDGYGRLAIRKGKFVDLVSQVKGGGTGPSDVQAFNGARQQAGADLGIFTCFEGRVTQNMRDAAASTGRFMDTQIVQIYTVEDYFANRRPKMPIAA